MSLYTPIANISIEHSLMGKSPVSYRFSTELGMNASLNAMRQLIKELPHPELVKITEIKREPYEGLNYSTNDVIMVKNLQVLILKDELEMLDDPSIKHFLCIMNGFQTSREELEYILTETYGIK